MAANWIEANDALARVAELSDGLRESGHAAEAERVRHVAATLIRDAKFVEYSTPPRGASWVEAVMLADRIGVLSTGRVMQIGTPRELYERPANLFVAQFIGSLKMNVISVRVEAERIVLDGRPGVEATALDGIAQLAGVVHLVVRPEHIDFADPEAGHARGTVQIVECLGADTFK